VDRVASAVMPERYLRMGVGKTEVLVTGQERGLAPVASKTSGGRGVSLRRSAKEMWDQPSGWEWALAYRLHVACCAPYGPGRARRRRRG
jgi:hypothetical protein